MAIYQSYIPVIKTTDAELRGYENLESKIKDRILPIFELTKSRRTKLVPYGDIHRRMTRIAEVVDGRPFILDLTTHSDLSNYQIEDLQDDKDGFLRWFEFLSQYDDLQIIPIIHVYADGDISETTNFVKKAAKKFSKLAFRVSYCDGDLPRYLDAISDGLGTLKSLVLTLDGGFVSDAHTVASVAKGMEERLEAIGEREFAAVSVASSSFPKSVRDVAGDAYGKFPMREVELYQRVQENVSVDLCYGDYASIHPYRYDTKGGNWVPRVDAPLRTQYIYTRRRRADGGYIKAASELVGWSEYVSAGSWGDRQIAEAAEGHPNGFSPVFWIAVRLNIHVTRRVADRDSGGDEAA